MNEEILNQILLEVRGTRAELNETKIELKEFKEETRAYWEKNEKRWEQNEQRWEENKRRWEKNEQRWEENKRRWEQNEQRWEENEKRWKKNEKRWDNNAITLANFRRSIKNDMNKLFEAIENVSGKSENETKERKYDISQIDGRLKLHSIRINKLENKVSNLCD